MPDVFACRCGQRLTVSPQSRGKQVRCPRCRQVLLIPAAATSRAAPPRQPAAPVPPPQPSRRFVFAGAALTLLAVTGSGVFLYLHNRSDDTSPPSEARNETPPPPPKDHSGKEQQTPVVKRQPDKPAPPLPRLPVAETEAAVLVHINSFRRQVGLLPVTLDAALSRSCRAQAEVGAAEKDGLLLPGDPLASVDAALASCFRRTLLPAPDLERIGVG